MTPLMARIDLEIKAAIDAQWAEEFARAEREYFDLMNSDVPPPAVRLIGLARAA